MQLKPLSAILAMTKEKLDEAMAPIRARQIRSKADLELAKLQEQSVTLERAVHELVATKEIDFSKLLDKMDDFDLNERRIKQLESLITQLFPTPTN